MAPSSSADTDPIVRKAQLAGGSTYTVSLPKDWADRQGLESGTELWLYALEDRVVVAPTATTPDRQSVTVDVDGLADATLTRWLQAAYRTGSDRIVVTAGDGLSVEQQRTAKRTLSSLVGVTLESATEESVEARNLLDSGEVSLEQSIAQLRQLVTRMHRDAVDAVVEKDDALARAIQRQTADIDRVVALVSRQFRGALVDIAEVEHLETDRLRAFRHERTAQRLRQIGEAAARIASLGQRLELPPPTAVVDGLRQCVSALSRMLDAALAGDIDEIARAREGLEAGLDAVEVTGPEDGEVVGRLLERYGQCAWAAAAIGDATTEVGLVGGADE